MARVSFTVRSTTAASGGSFLRVARNVLAGEDEDSALRQDGLLIAPQTFDTNIAFLQADLVEYGEVDLLWGGIPIVTTLTASPQITTMVLVSSPIGPPQTLANGTILVEDGTTFSFTDTGVATGQWAYYSLFVRFQSNVGDDYYERLASIEVLPPKEYGSTDLLFQRIPSHYREQDTQGALYRFLSIFGFDMDRIRTILDYLMTAKDPLLADSAVLNALGDQMAAILEGNDLGTSRLRAFMNDIGYFGRAKGTPPSLRFWGKSLTEGDVKISSDTYTVKLLSQRVNYITDPKDGTGIISVRAASPTEADVGQALPFTDTSFSGGHPYSPSGTIFASAAGISYVMVRVASLVPIHLHDHVALSIHSGVGTDAVKWARLVTQDGLEVGAQPNPTRAAGAKAFDVEVITGVLS